MTSEFKSVLLREGGGLLPKKVWLKTDGGLACIDKRSEHLPIDYVAYSLMCKYGIGKYFSHIAEPTRVSGMYSMLVEYIPYDLDVLMSGCSEKNRPGLIRDVIWQLTDVVSALEAKRVVHGDMHLGNVRFTADCRLKIIDLETMVDYATKSIYPKEVVEASKETQVTMGWNSTFCAGTDLNQIVGEIWDRWGEYFPSKLASHVVKNLRVCKGKFPYAVFGGNAEMSGCRLISVLSEK